MKVEIYDPPKCPCKKNSCLGTETAAVIDKTLKRLKKQGVTVERFNILDDYKTVKENPQVMSLLDEKSASIFPLTIVDGKIFKTTDYPSYEEICEELNIPIMR